jgi:hypothetical protein
MSLKTLLAVGESFFGVSTEPSPYEVRKNGLLPVFGPANSSASEQKQDENLLPSIPTENGEKAAEPELDFEARQRGEHESRVKLAPERSRIEKAPEERRTFLDRRVRHSGDRKLTQAEMGLEQVTPVRNDLSDSDLELAPRRAAKSVESDLNPFAPRPIAAIGRPAHEKQGWAARLMRLFGFLHRGRP